MKRALQSIKIFFTQLLNTVESCLLILLFSSVKVARETRRSRLKNRSGSKINVLGNGPSLKKALEDGVVDTTIDCMAVNLFVVSDFFWKLKPKYYYLADDNFWNPQDERTIKESADFLAGINMVDWSMELFIPSHKNAKGLISKIHNKNVTVRRMNTIQVDGFQGFKNYMYRIHLGAPRCQTVLNMALVSAINKRYESIYLYGADHSWTRDLFVDDENIVCYGDRHVYNPDLTIIKVKNNIADELECFVKMFRSHYGIAGYAKKVGSSIYNCTKGSFVDAYPRKYE